MARYQSRVSAPVVSESSPWSVLIIAIVVLLAVGFFLGGFIMMILMSILHVWWPVVPTMGYWTSSWVALLLRALLSNSIQTKNNK